MKPRLMLLLLACMLVPAFAFAQTADLLSQAKKEGEVILYTTMTVGDFEAGCKLAVAYDAASVCIMPFYLKRCYKYLPADRFELQIVNSADPYGAVPLARIKIGGHMLWQGPHPIAPGTQKVNFVADETYEVTPLAQGFVDVLNKVASVERPVRFKLVVNLKAARLLNVTLPTSVLLSANEIIE